MKILPNINDVLSWKINKFRWNSYNTIISFWKTYSEEWGIEIPEYQRGDIWTTEQKQNLIRSLIFWIQVPNLILNKKPKWYDWTIIDWQQRYNSLVMFFNDKLTVDWIKYSDLNNIQKRCFLNTSLWYIETQFKTIDKEKEFYILLNTWWTQHSKEDIEKVK